MAPSHQHICTRRPWSLPAQHRAYPWIAVAAAAVFLVRVLLTITTTSHTIDEPAHLASGVAAIEAHKHVYDVIHPPLPRIWAAIPLLLYGAELPESRDVTIVSSPPAFEGGERLLLHGPLPYRSALIASRCMMLVFALGVLLYVYLFGRWVGNSLVGMLAVVFISVDPTLLAHSGLITTDVPSALGFLVGGYHGLRWIVYRTVRSAVAAGAGMALAVGLKLSCVFLVPPLVLVMVLRPLPVFWSRAGAGGHRWRRYFRRWPSIGQIVVAAAVFGFVLWAIYLFDVDPLASQRVMADKPSWVATPMWLRNLPIPMPSFVMGIWLLVGKGTGGTTAAYLFGEISTAGWWYYFPVTILLKSPVGFLAALGLATASFLLLPRRYPWRTLLILAPPSAYAAMAMLGNLNFGIRHIFLLLPFLYLFTCFHLARGRRVLLLIPLIALAAIESATVHPRYLSFFNIAAGGPQNGERYLLDSNLDWGQDVGAMAEWLKREAIVTGRPYSIRAFNATAPYVEGFGLDPASTQGPVRGLLAISKSVRYGLDGHRVLPDGQVLRGYDYRWLEQYPLVARIGDSIDVYDLGNDAWIVRRVPSSSAKVPTPSTSSSFRNAEDEPPRP